MSEISQRAALIAACRANRECDLPRLVFADFLDESGSEADAARAAAIRLGVELLRRGESLTKHSEVMTRFLPSPPHVDAIAAAVCDRGFFVEFASHAEWWLANGDELVAEHDVQRVRLTTWPGIEFVGGGNTSIAARFRAYRDREQQVGVPLVADLDASFTLRLLRATWPGVEFTLPPPTYEAHRFYRVRLRPDVSKVIGDFVYDDELEDATRRGDAEQITVVTRGSDADGFVDVVSTDPRTERRVSLAAFEIGRRSMLERLRRVVDALVATAEGVPVVDRTQSEPRVVGHLANVREDAEGRIVADVLTREDVDAADFGEPR